MNCSSHRAAVAKCRHTNMRQRGSKKHRALTKESNEVATSSDASNPRTPEANQRTVKRRTSSDAHSQSVDGTKRKFDVELPPIEVMSNAELIELLHKDEDSTCHTLTQPGKSASSQVRRGRGRPKLQLNRRGVYKNQVIQKL
ncbi:unnamed protein product [Echinostoma caproni]|uniref:Uncharacterized protein n=1 Tax=Echinostoma caproni TaxID=27848 RepID=A0A183A230_9TREM|nr:unnamed protein product [Echinostoma caproni]